MVRVLVVEDEFEFRATLLRDLTAQGYSVRSVDGGWAALREISRQTPDAVLLDLGLPDLDGLEVLKMLRGICDVPVIVVTALSAPTIAGILNTGADDHMVKPVSIEELCARLQAVIRRRVQAEPPSGQTPPGVLEVGDLRVDLIRREVTVDSRTVELTRREFDLLAFLAARPQHVVSRTELLEQVWQQPYGGRQTVDVHLSWLRRKLGETADAPRYLHTVRGIGFKLVAPEKGSAVS